VCVCVCVFFLMWCHLPSPCRVALSSSCCPPIVCMQGNAIETQALWRKHLPDEIRADLETQKFEFYLQLYFAIFPFLPGKPPVALSFSGSGGKVGVARALRAV
jgi:hypothetical protein